MNTIAPLVDTWTGPALVRLDASGELVLPLTELHALYWLAGLSTDSPPPFEVRVSGAGTWMPPAPTHELGVASGPDGVSLGIPANWGGWVAFWAARRAADALAGVPDGAVIELATAAQIYDDDGDANRTVGRVRFRGTVAGGKWHITEVSPKVSHDALTDAVAFARRLATDRWLLVRGDRELQALAGAAATFAPGDDELVWVGDAVRHFDATDERTLLLLAGPVFRTRYAGTWAMDTDDHDLDEDDGE